MKAIVIGATSGIGRELVKVLAQNGYQVTATGRRIELLQSLQSECNGGNVHIETMDVTDFDCSRAQLLTIAEKMEGLDLVVINSGVGDLTTKWDKELHIINTNAVGFAAIANAAYHYFETQRGGKGHIVGISSVAAEKGSGMTPMYSATKAFISRYMEGLKFRSIRKKIDIAVTDVRPGFVDTPMTQKNNFPMPWMATSERAARQIYSDIKNRRKITYITRRWRLISWLLAIVPDRLMGRFG